MFVALPARLCCTAVLALFGMHASYRATTHPQIPGKECLAGTVESVRKWFQLVSEVDVTSKHQYRSAQAPAS